MRNNIVKIILAASTILVSCGDEQQYFPALGKADEGSTRLKFIHAASDTVGLNLFLDGNKITGNAPSTITTTGAVNMGTVKYDASFPVTDYVSVDNTSGGIELIVPEVYAAADTFPTKTLSTTDASLTASKSYTVALVGITGAYETVVYEDDLSVAPIDGKAYIRFAGFIDNLADGDELTLRATPPATTEDPAPVPVVLFQDVTYKEMTGFIALPRTGKYTNVQLVNETTAAVIYTLPATSSFVTFLGNKAYTMYARGRIGGAVPALSRMTNR
jgi:hypothetical protein